MDRLGRLCYLLPALLAATGVTALALTLAGLWDGGVPHRTFAPGERVTVRLNHDVQAGLYVAGARRADARCSVTGPAGRPVTPKPVSGTVAVTTGGTRWYLLAALRPTRSGDYTVTC